MPRCAGSRITDGQPCQRWADASGFCSSHHPRSGGWHADEDSSVEDVSGDPVNDPDDSGDEPAMAGPGKGSSEETHPRPAKRVHSEDDEPAVHSEDDEPTAHSEDDEPAMAGPGEGTSKAYDPNKRQRTEKLPTPETKIRQLIQHMSIQNAESGVSTTADTSSGTQSSTANTPSTLGAQNLTTAASSSTLLENSPPAPALQSSTAISSGSAALSPPAAGEKTASSTLGATSSQPSEKRIASEMSTTSEEDVGPNKNLRNFAYEKAERIIRNAEQYARSVREARNDRWEERQQKLWVSVADRFLKEVPSSGVKRELNILKRFVYTQGSDLMLRFSILEHARAEMTSVAENRRRSV